MSSLIINTTQVQTPAPVESEALSGVLAGTHVLTLDGEIPVEFLNEGDRVITRNGARVLRNISSRLVSDVRVVKVRAGSLGHDRPGRDLYMSVAQRVLVRDWRAQAIFHARQAMVPVERLTDGQFVRVVHMDEARLFTLAFDSEETIYADGVELGCDKVTVTA
jgi:hypothetical protein